MAVTSYGRNKNHDDAIKKTKRRPIIAPAIAVRLLKKPLARKRIFVQTPFSHSALNLQRKNFLQQNHSLFRSTSCFGVTKITAPIWLQKSWKWEQIIKKRQRPNTIQILWIVKNQEHRNIASLSLQLRSYKKKEAIFESEESHMRPDYNFDF